MPTVTFKILLFMKRRPGMTMQAFQDYYENHHAPLCGKYSAGIARYQRRFLTAHPNPETGDVSELAYDVITELWFENETLYRDTLNYLTTSIMPDEIVEDERKLFDRPKLRIATVIECDSPLKI